jgi:hypothetical protein
LGDAVITWTAYWKTRELHVLTLAGGTPGERGELLTAAARAAFEAGLPLVRYWEARTLVLPPTARREPRTDEVPMFLPLRAEVREWAVVERGLWA